MLINSPENFDNYILDEINSVLDEETPGNKLSEMTYLERKFLNGIVRLTKPKKILEVGVAAGGSSSIILNAIKDMDNSILYSIDYNEKFYRDTNKDCGFIIKEKFPHLLKNYKLYTGGVAAKFMEEIGDNIDLCLLDTMHCNPGEFLDFLMILPYMKKNSIIIIHDIFIAATNLILFNTIKGKKILFENKDEIFKNYGIGAIILDSDIMNYIFDYFLLLKLSWNYIPTEEDIQYIIKLFKKYYGIKMAEFFAKIVNYNKKELYISKCLSDYTNKINKIAWWIPFRNARDSFRERKINELKNGLEEKIKYTKI